MNIRIRGMGVVTRIQTGSIEAIGAMTSQEADIVHQGVLAGHPPGTNPTTVNAVREEAETGNDVVAALRCLKKRAGRAGIVVGQSPGQRGIGSLCAQMGVKTSR
jgi:hypothetical protein